MRRFALVLFCAVLAGGWALAADSTGSATAQMCTAVKDRTPEGVGDRFPASVGQVYCFSEVINGQPKVVQVWYHADREVFRIELPVRAARWRTWSVKRIPDAQKGAWHVDVQDPSGKVLATARFTVE
jgi:Protein of unknown function (DUF2914)